MEKELQECIEGCRHGDPKAQSDLYVRYAPPNETERAAACGG